MQPTNEQVERSLAALRAAPLAPDGSDGSSPPPTDGSTVPEDLTWILSRLPEVRSDRVAAARRRLDTGDQPTAQELADRMLGRLVCDRLR